MKNLSKSYYKDYFVGIDFDFLLNSDSAPENTKQTIKERNRELCSPHLLKTIESNPLTSCTFKLQIAYPGLVTGVGINHEAKIEGEFKLGVHFDYTWGMPIVYGSSVKGVLRSYFKDFYEGDIDMIDLFHDIFNGEERDYKTEEAKYNKLCQKESQRVYKSKSIYKRDIFFDAVITKADTKGRILCPDSITPHGDNPLKNPIPITFLKIAPGCEMEFRFKLVDSKVGDKTFSAVSKKALFEEILKTVGIGAKTNVGYGQLEQITKS